MSIAISKIRVKILLRFTGYCFLSLVLAGCSLLHRKAGLGTAGETTSLVAYSGPKARIAVADFDVKATKATAGVGSGVREMLIAALVKSNRFSVVERPQAQAAATQAAQVADLIITGSVSEFEPQASGGRAGVGGGGGVGSGVLGGLLGPALNKSHISLEINILESANSKALAATRVLGNASDVAGAVKGGFLGSDGLSAGLSAYANSPMEKAIRICIIEAVRYISEAVPKNYYKYNQDGKT